MHLDGRDCIHTRDRLDFGQEERRGMKILYAVLAIGVCSGVLVAQAPPRNANATAPTNAKVGQVAPDFTLHSSTGKDISLSDYRGKKNVVLAFIVKAFTGG